MVSLETLGGLHSSPWSGGGQDRRGFRVRRGSHVLPGDLGWVRDPARPPLLT